MKLIAVTQRIDSAQHYSESRDGLDQRWWSFFEAANLCPLILPNHLNLAQKIVKNCPPEGVLLTGGNSHESCQGKTPERDQVDKWLIEWSKQNQIPLLGICRGMQSIQIEAGLTLDRVQDQVQQNQEVLINGDWQSVNSYHHWGSTHNCEAFETWARDSQGIVKAVRHQEGLIWGIMWHPERLDPYREADIKFFKQVFKS